VARRHLDLASEGEPDNALAAAVDLASHSSRATCKFNSPNTLHPLNSPPEESAVTGGSTAEAAHNKENPIMLSKTRGQTSRENWKDEDTFEPKTKAEKRGARRSLEAFNKGVAGLGGQSIPRLRHCLDKWRRSDQQVAATLDELAKKEVGNPDMAENVV
jgi:hypothetical protein